MLAYRISKFKSFKHLFASPKVIAVWRVCGVQAFLAVAMVLLLAMTTISFVLKFLCSLTIVYLQVWMLLRAVEQHGS
jgi:hypothetical protein